MTDEGMRRQRLEELLDLAQAYRGWNRKKLALALSRDASNLSPASGLPKLDFLVELVRADADVSRREFAREHAGPAGENVLMTHAEPLLAL